MIWKWIYLTAFLGGLALAVSSMLGGIERWRRRRSAKSSPFFNPPTVAGLAVGFGASGYLLITRSRLSTLGILIIAIIVGIGSLAGMIILMARWALRDHGTALPEEEDINGQVATVTRSITTDQPGEISWVAWNRKHALPARSIDGSEISAGTEVVIDIVEDGVARVELWSVVEQRL